MAPGATDTPVVAFSNPQAVAAKPQETCGSRRQRRMGNARLGNRLERAKGFEPSTPTLARLCSTPELRPRSVGRRYLPRPRWIASRRPGDGLDFRASRGKPRDAFGLAIHAVQPTLFPAPFGPIASIGLPTPRGSDLSERCARRCSRNRAPRRAAPEQRRRHPKTGGRGQPRRGGQGAAKVAHAGPWVAPCLLAVRPASMRPR